ncbi:MAG: hypothetical protein V1913_14910 [Fibrobacterota bacterium]
MTPHKFPVKPVLILNLLAVLVLLIYFNNAKRFTRKPAPAAPVSSVAKPSAVLSAKTVVQAPAERRYRSDLPPVLCKTRDTVGYLVKAGLAFVYADPVLSVEIREKEEGIRTLVRYVFADKVIAQIEAERCRKEILEKVNRFLTRGRVEDAVFTAFDIVPSAPDMHNATADTPSKENP